MSEPLQPPPAVPAGATRPLGVPRSIPKQVLLSVVTFGLYGVYWAYRSHEDVYLHSGSGINGLIGALIYVFVGVITLFLLPIEIKRMYEQDSRTSPVGPATAFWVLLFAIPWYVKCQGALNQYWISKGAVAP